MGDAPQLETRFVVDTTVYEPAAVRATAYQYGDICEVRIEGAGEDRVEVRLVVRRQVEDWGDRADRFWAKLLDEQIRLDLAHRTGHLRDLVYQRAFEPAEKSR